ncbi:MAG TPA: GNAT family protein [Usitatibacter sp.]|nr:GNAT family protein [Usitatibacter sp.]
MGVILQALLLDIPDTLETPRLWLRATRGGGGTAINAAVAESHAELAPWMPWARVLPSAAETEQHCAEMQAKWLSREVLDFSFIRKADGLLLGKGGLHTIDWTLPKMEIGYWIRTSCAGQGFATEATLCLVALARDRLAARRLEITSDARNAASRRVAEKSGFTLEGILRQSRRGMDGALADSCMYAQVF